MCRSTGDGNRPTTSDCSTNSIWQSFCHDNLPTLSISGENLLTYLNFGFNEKRNFFENVDLLKILIFLKMLIYWKFLFFWKFWFFCWKFWFFLIFLKILFWKFWSFENLDFFENFNFFENLDFLKNLIFSKIWIFLKILNFVLKILIF